MGARDTGRAGAARTYRAAPSSRWKVMLTLCLVFLVGGGVLFVLEPSWGLGVALLGLLLQVSFWWGQRPGWIEVSDAGVRVRGAGGGFLRPREVPWRGVRAVRRPRWSEGLVLDLVPDGELVLPQLAREDREALVADVSGRLSTRP